MTKVIFMGTPGLFSDSAGRDFEPDEAFDIVAVVTTARSCCRPKKKIRMTLVKELALAHGVANLSA